ncbi:MAG: peptidylprolyl isomerase [Rhodocyclaceae bacterium]|nr:peptidylprolyl isomerase [Rhodocyclaceae bacterium]
MRIFWALCLILCASGALAQPREPLFIDRVIAVVNDEAITAGELKHRLQEVERQFSARGGQLPAREVLEKQLLERLIVERIQLQYAREIGLTVGEAEVDAALARIAANNRMSVAELRAALNADGIDWRRFREEIRNEMVIARLKEREVDSRIVVTEGEIDNYLAHHDATSETQVVLAHIIVRVPEQADARQLARLSARAEEARARLLAGEDFARVAAAYSDAPDALSGGVLEPRPLDRLPTLYAEAVARLAVGETSNVLRSPAGFHIIRLLEKKGGALREEAVRQTRARHILIKVGEGASEAEARHRLATLKERLDHGADFAELARQYSQDLSAAKGGELGWLYPGDTVPEFERAMDALGVGEISAPVRTPFGWHLIQVLERKTAVPGSERQRLLARQALRERKADEAYEDWLRQLRDRAYVEYRLEER